MGKRQILVNLDEDLIERIDAVTGPRERSAWISQACEAALAGGGAPPTGDDTEATIWRICAAAILEAWRQECGDGQDVGNGNGKAHVEVDE